MTSKKQLKARVRARMAKTGESYTTALRQVAGGSPGSSTALVVDHGYALRGGLHPETAAIANVLAHHGIVVDGQPVTEALVFGVGGGPGAGYILWEFAKHSSKDLTLGFRNQLQYPDRWLAKTLGRLGVRFDVHYTSGRKGASARLTEELAVGRPCLVRPDWALIGYWGLPESYSGHGGHTVIAYRAEADVVFVDDRNVSPLSVEREKLDVARDRVTSYRNALHSIDPATGDIKSGTLRSAVESGLADFVEHLSARSDSFSLPAWRKWSRLLTDTRNAKAWPKVFGDRQGLAGALLSTWEGVMPMGMTGGHLRDLTADFLDEAADLLGDERLRGPAGQFREAAAAWQRVAVTALPDEVPDFVRLRELTTEIRESVADPSSVDPAADGVRAVAEELWAVRRRLDREFPLDGRAVGELLEALSAAIARVFELETAAVSHLRKLVA